MPCSVAVITATFPANPSGPARQARNTVKSTVPVYAGCIHGGEPVSNQRIEAALHHL